MLERTILYLFAVFALIDLILESPVPLAVAP